MSLNVPWISNKLWAIEKLLALITVELDQKWGAFRRWILTKRKNIRLFAALEKLIQLKYNLMLLKI